MLKEIKKNIKKKYSFATFNKDQLTNYFTLLKIIKDKNTKPLIKKIKCKSNTEKFFLNILNKKRLNLNENKKLKEFYKKFNVNLKLKKSYNKKMKKITNSNCENRTYLFLAIVLLEKKINLQKYSLLNTILKIIDINLLTYKKLNKLEKVFLEKIINKTFTLLRKA